MKRMCYVEEKINPIIPTLVIFMNIFSIVYIIGELLQSNEDLAGYIGLLIMLIILDIFYCFVFLREELKNKFKYYKIKKEGTRYEGNIEGFNYDSYIHNYVDTNNKTYHAFTLNIRYGANALFKTPIVDFNPMRDLGSKECDIYVYNSQVYATGFKKRKIGENIIWDENDEAVKKATRRKNIYFEQNKEGIIIAGVFICAVVGIVIYQIINSFLLNRGI